MKALIGTLCLIGSVILLLVAFDLRDPMLLGLAAFMHAVFHGLRLDELIDALRKDGVTP